MRSRFEKQQAKARENRWNLEVDKAMAVGRAVTVKPLSESDINLIERMSLSERRHFFLEWVTRDFHLSGVHPAVITSLDYAADHVLFADQKSPVQEQKLVDSLHRAGITDDKAIWIASQMNLATRDVWASQKGLPLLCSEALQAQIAAGTLFDAKEIKPEAPILGKDLSNANRLAAERLQAKATTMVQPLPEIELNPKESLSLKEIHLAKSIADTAVRTIERTLEKTLSYDFGPAEELARELTKSKSLGS